MPRIELSASGGPDFARAIMTTDTRPKEVAVAVRDGGGGAYTVGGCAKGSGMIHPNMATMLAYVTTDAAVDRGLLRTLMREAADATFNMVTRRRRHVLQRHPARLANGAAGGPAIDGGHARGRRRCARRCWRSRTQLARELARDGEGAQHLIEVDVSTGAASVEDARNVARTVALSSLVKTAVAGYDPNWGRILVAAGRAGAPVEARRRGCGCRASCSSTAARCIAFDEATCASA